MECGWFSLEILIEGYVLSGSFYQYITRLGAFKTQIGVCKAAEERITSLLGEQNDNGHPIFQELYMSLPEKGIWLVKGENGAGKSTLFSIISGYNHCDEKIFRNGKILDAETRRLMTGWCPQLYLQLSESFRELVEIIPKEEIDQDYLQMCIAQNEIIGDKYIKQIFHFKRNQYNRSMVMFIRMNDFSKGSQDDFGIERFERCGNDKLEAPSWVDVTVENETE